MQKRQVVHTNEPVGSATVQTSNADFADSGIVSLILRALVLQPVGAPVPNHHIPLSDYPTQIADESIS